jgi:hypothetical protein
MNRSALTEEAFQALLRLKQDMYAVAVAASELGSSYDRVVLKLILRNAAHGAIRAFSARDGQRDAAWKHVILLIDEMLRHRLPFRPASDRVELARLQVFVNENADAFERVSQLRVVRSATG